MADSPQVFAIDVKDFCEKAKAAPVIVASKAGMDATSVIIERSPVDTGRFRANWYGGTGSLRTTTTMALDKSGKRAEARILGQISRWDGIEPFFISNSLPYAIPLEYGSSKQAPLGMVRITVTEWQTFVQDAIRELPQ